MEHDKAQTRQIAINLNHDPEGASTLYTRVQYEPHHSLPIERARKIHNPTVNLPEVTDVGWDPDKMRPGEYALDGIRNEDVWLLVRRFNKRVFHLEHRPDHPEGELDLDVAAGEQFSPNKLRAQVERLYMGVSYFTAWYLNMLMPTLWATLMAILLYPKIRSTLFPRCPPSLVHYREGSLMNPPAGIFSTADTATGAPENLKGEALEREASNFATGLVALSINTFVDKDPQHDASQKGGGKTADFPDPRIATLGFGIGFFGSAFSTRIYKWLKLGMAKSAFKEIPTDSQLTITLLRQGERNKAPLPPPPVPKGPPPHEPRYDILSGANGDRPLGATQEELQAAIGEDVSKTEHSGGGDHESCASGSNGKRRGKLLSVVKPVALAAAKTVISVDKLRAKTGSETAKHRIGAASPREKPPIAGPVEFTCRWRGERGFVYLTTDTVSPCLCFSKKSSVGDLDNSNYQTVQPDWVIPVADIMTLNKYSGYGTKAKLLAGWALEGEVLDGLEVLDNKGKSVLMTAMAHRDQLFNRLCSIGNQKWQIW
ncbi:hypothetical protein FSARC_2813 [Fusarium sarcochroum]|uniref:Uncharacterized protein n=1 Tax=Fusarium sarcochroum TaxID=1208366 RepID=A0A8H4XCK1_9HYPO|nr:hypothetical protein FSARC_2813 [Fusarium sarcochroum]